jgi:hypothetical protein
VPVKTQSPPAKAVSIAAPVKPKIVPTPTKAVVVQKKAGPAPAPAAAPAAGAKKEEEIKDIDGSTGKTVGCAKGYAKD